MHRLRPPDRQRLERAQMRGRLPHPGPQVHGRGGSRRLYQGGRIPQTGEKGQGQAPGLLPEPAQAVYCRDGLRPRGEGSNYR